MALKYYDIDLDAFREPTQEDIDIMQAGVQAYGQLRTAITQTQERLMASIAEIKRRGPVMDVPE